jgi:hypothetical protein
MATTDTTTVQMIKELAAAGSSQSNVSNKIWIGLMTAVVVAVLPRVSTSGQCTVLALPLGLGNIDPKWFDPILFLILVVLTIAFSAAHAQQVRAQKLAQSFLKSISHQPSSFAGIYPRDLYDVFRLPSLNRVAPLAQSVRGKYQFYPHSRQCPRWLRWGSTVYYVLLKLMAMAVYFCLPAVALWLSYTRANPSGFLRWSLLAIGAVALIALIQGLFEDILYSAGVARVISSAQIGNG